MKFQPLRLILLRCNALEDDLKPWSYQMTTVCPRSRPFQNSQGTNLTNFRLINLRVLHCGLAGALSLWNFPRIVWSDVTNKTAINCACESFHQADRSSCKLAFSALTATLGHRPQADRVAFKLPLLDVTKTDRKAISRAQDSKIDGNTFIK